MCVLVEAAPISDPVGSGVDMLVKGKFADTIGNWTTLLELVSDHPAVPGYVFETSRVSWNSPITPSIAIN